MAHATSGRSPTAFWHSFSTTRSQILVSPASHSSFGTLVCFSQIISTAAFSLSWSLRMSHATSGRAATAFGHSFSVTASQILLSVLLVLVLEDVAAPAEQRPPSGTP